jgi:hypothetical protein
MVEAPTQLHYELRYTSLAAVEESLTWMIKRGELPDQGSRLGGQPVRGDTNEV